MLEAAKDFTDKAIGLRSEGRFHEAILAARRATTLDPDDANGWWQLALAQRELDGAGALASLHKVTELAPGFAAGWCELGRLHHEAGRPNDAIPAYEAALSADEDHVRSMRMLAFALKSRENDADKKRRLELLRRVHSVDSLDQSDLFDLAYLLGEAKEHLEAAHVYESYTREHQGQASFYNLALCYKRLGRDADALDALDTAARNGYEDDNKPPLIEGTQARLLTLRRKVLGSPLATLSKEDWYLHYVNPFTLLNLADVDDALDNPKVMQRAKQAVFREIELEEGRVDWMPGLVIDRSSAMALFETLNDEAQREAHRRVYDDPALNAFLMRGHVEHFLAREATAYQPELPHLIEPEVLRVIGPKFALQYGAVLTRALEGGDLAVVECLFDGRRWVLPEHEERCYEGAKRVLERLCEPLLKLSAASEKRLAALREIERTLEVGKLGALLPHLPIEFYDTHHAVGRALREMAVAFYNREQDAEQAKAILQLGKVSAEKSASLWQQVSEDEKFLDETIAKERASEAHLNFGKTALSITKAGVVYGDKKFAPKDIIAARWGLVQTSNSPPTVRHTIAFQGERNADIVVTWTSTSDLERQRGLWAQLVDATLNYLMNDVMVNVRRRLESRELSRIGSLEVNPTGVVFEISGWISTKRLPVAWRDLTSHIANGDLFVRYLANNKAVVSMPLESTYNAIALHMLCNNKESSRS